MADTTTSVLTNLIQTAYDKYAEMALRSIPLHRDVVDKRPVDVAMPGSSVKFSIYADMSAQTSTLTEGTDVTSVAITNPTQVTVTLNEYGAAVSATRLLELESFTDVDPAIGDIVSFNMADSLDALVRDIARQGTNAIYSNAGAVRTSGNGTTLTSSDTFKSPLARYAVAKLRANNAVPRRGDLYWCGIHPEVSHDLRAETGAGGWRTPHEYSSNTNIWAGEIGAYEGAFFVETPRMYNATDGAASAKDHRTIFAGKQALVEAVAQEPSVVIGPVVDKLMRMRHIGWYGVLGWARFRESALYRVESGTSI
jgi:N4-gp56 family major capsid protein